MRDLWNDVRHALRALVVRPGYALAALLTLALGIGVTTAVFSALHGYLLRPLPFPDGERLVNVYAHIEQFGPLKLGISAADYLDVRERAKSFASIGIYDGGRARLGRGAGSTRVDVVFMTPSMLATLGVAPQLGRRFTEQEGLPGRAEVVLLAHEAWQKRFGGARDVLGRRIDVDGKSVEVVGVMPAGFELPHATHAELLLPMTIDPAARSERGKWDGNTLARLAPGVTAAAAEREVRALWRQFVVEHPNMTFFVEELGYQVVVETLRDSEVAELRRTLPLLQVASLLVLLVAAANLAGLTLSRLAGRGRELAVRSALGGGTRRLLRLVIVENLLLAATGGVAGLLLARAALSFAERRGLAPSTVLVSLQPDTAVFGAGLALALATGLLTSLAPLWWLRRAALEGVLRAEGRGSTGGGRGAQRLRSALVVGQVAVALTLAVLVGLLGASLRRLLAVDVGFESAGVLVGHLSRSDDEAERRRFDRRPLLEAVRALPGVQGAAITDCPPFGSCASLSTFSIVGAPVVAGQRDFTAHLAEVSPGFFATLRIPVLAGRGFSAADLGGPPVTVVDRAFAERWFRGRSPLGQRIDLGDEGEAPQHFTIVGVVGRVRSQDLARDDDTPMFYTTDRELSDGAYLVARFAASAGAAESLRAAVTRADPTTKLASIAGMEDRVRSTLSGRTAPMLLVGSFAALATLLAALGVYAVLALTVARRRVELGVRAALGADRGNLLRLVLGQGARLLAAGMALGALSAVGASALVASLLFEVERTDPVVYLAALAALFGIGLLACWLPAARAAASDPRLALRQE
jgi:predicted permease